MTDAATDRDIPAEHDVADVVEACRYRPPTGSNLQVKRHVETLYRLIVETNRGRAIEMWEFLSPWERRLARGSMLERFAVRWWVRILPVAWRADLRISGGGK